MLSNVPVVLKAHFTAIEQLALLAVQDAEPNVRLHGLKVNQRRKKKKKKEEKKKEEKRKERRKRKNDLMWQTFYRARAGKESSDMQKKREKVRERLRGWGVGQQQ